MAFLLQQLIDRAAERAPDRDAVRSGGQGLTYGSLSSRSSQLARVLREQGVRRGDRVAIYAGKGLDAATAIYGIMKAGAAYVPIDPSAPPHRIELILRDCAIRHIVSEPSRSEAVVALHEGGVPLDGVVGIEPREGSTLSVAPWGDVFDASTTDPSVGTMEQDLAYVLYTSGSTGVPKGVMHTHRSALSWAEASAQTYGLRPEDRVSNHAPLHFDLSTLDYFSTAVAGATTVVVPEVYTRMPASFSKLIETEGLTVLYAVPLALTHLLLHGAMDQRDLGSVRWVLFGGEPFPTKHLRALMQAIPSARFSNVYGPTEVNGVTFWFVPPLAEDSDSPIPIGSAFPNVELLVVDADDEPVGENEQGELLARTPTMMQGYWGRPDLNARAFFARPAAGDREDVFHRTGDLVRRRPDGCLEFLGRIDRQVKVRGYRIELDEVEVSLNSHEAVENAAVFVLPDGSGSQRIVAAVKVHEGQVLDADILRAHAAATLPAYCLPDRIDFVDQFPETSTGKIDRLALREKALASGGDSRS